MATITVTCAVGSKHLSGGRDIRNDDATADVTLSFDNTKIKLKSDLLEACKAMVSRLGSDQLK